MSDGRAVAQNQQKKLISLLKGNEYHELGTGLFGIRFLSALNNAEFLIIGCHT
jgi:hypothetical protein